MTSLSIKNLPEDVLFHILSYLITAIEDSVQFYPIIKDAEKFILQRMKPHLDNLFSKLEFQLKYDRNDPFWTNFEYTFPLYAAPDSPDAYFSIDKHMGRCLLKPANEAQLQRVLYYMVENQEHYNQLITEDSDAEDENDNENDNENENENENDNDNDSFDSDEDIVIKDFKQTPFGLYKESRYLRRCFYDFAWRNLHSPELYWFLYLLRYGWQNSIRASFEVSETKTLREFVVSCDKNWEAEMGYQVRERFKIIFSVFGILSLFESPHKFVFKERLKIIMHLDVLSFLMNALICAVPLFPLYNYSCIGIDKYSFIFVLGSFALVSIVFGMSFYPFWHVIKLLDYVVVILLSQFIDSSAPINQ